MVVDKPKTKIITVRQAFLERGERLKQIINRRKRRTRRLHSHKATMTPIKKINHPKQKQEIFKTDAELAVAVAKQAVEQGKVEYEKNQIRKQWEALSQNRRRLEYMRAVLQKKQKEYQKNPSEEKLKEIRLEEQRVNQGISEYNKLVEELNSKRQKINEKVQTVNVNAGILERKIRNRGKRRQEENIQEIVKGFKSWEEKTGAHESARIINEELKGGAKIGGVRLPKISDFTQEYNIGGLKFNGPRVSLLTPLGWAGEVVGGKAAAALQTINGIDNTYNLYFSPKRLAAGTQTVPPPPKNAAQATILSNKETVITPAMKTRTIINIGRTLGFAAGAGAQMAITPAIAKQVARTRSTNVRAIMSTEIKKPTARGTVRITAQGETVGKGKITTAPYTRKTLIKTQQKNILGKPFKPQYSLQYDTGVATTYTGKEGVVASQANTPFGKVSAAGIKTSKVTKGVYLVNEVPKGYSSQIGLFKTTEVARLNSGKATTVIEKTAAKGISPNSLGGVKQEIISKTTIPAGMDLKPSGTGTMTRLKFNVPTTPTMEATVSKTTLKTSTLASISSSSKTKSTTPTPKNTLTKTAGGSHPPATINKTATINLSQVSTGLSMKTSTLSLQVSKITPVPAIKTITETIPSNIQRRRSRRRTKTIPQANINSNTTRQIPTTIIDKKEALKITPVTETKPITITTKITTPSNKSTPMQKTITTKLSQEPNINLVTTGFINPLTPPGQPIPPILPTLPSLGKPDLSGGYKTKNNTSRRIGKQKKQYTGSIAASFMGVTTIKPFKKLNKKIFTGLEIRAIKIFKG